MSRPEAYDAAPFVPEAAGIEELREAAADCAGCPLFREATQTVFGAGPASSRAVLLGEQPGDQEDRKGEPFAGPAGGMLLRACEEAGVDRDQAYVTNAVKHFKFAREGHGKQRIHKSPSLRELTACKPWLEAELRAVSPEVVVTLGATAGKALFGSAFRVTKERGTVLEAPGGLETGVVVPTIHPSAVLRAGENRDEVYAGLVSDLRVAADVLG
ncbi:UdgX family uracil-DNA binding protein [Streptomyces boncukensis]|uniref:Type-4 uracil-DNA glycosylase n=1 Tax=Streptomyces boncukensis TaxID=2711219 RepID=A0A6G4WQP6_9ACTN|nr:UdgX family uracil-DNA binding protein [Streptomyces boncukensis]